MFLSFLKIVFKSIIKQRTFLAANLAGLSAGLAVFFLTALYIYDELKYDMYHDDVEQVYRVSNKYEKNNVGEHSSGCPFPLIDGVKRENPDLVEHSARFFNFWMPQAVIKYKDKAFNEKRFFWADSSTFEIFDWKFIEGNSKTALSRQGTVVITESTAKKYFGTTQNVLGKVLQYEDGFELEVTGVVEDTPVRSHFKFDFLASMVSVNFFLGDYNKYWVWNPCWTYVKLKKGKTEEDLQDALNSFVQNNYKSDQKNNISFHPQKLGDIHLKSQLDYEIEPNSSLSNLYILVGIAVFVLLIVLINFVNLSTASSQNRAKETVLKKVLGTTRIELTIQYLAESIVLFFVGVFIALIIVELVLPFFNSFTGKEISLQDFISIKIGGSIILFGLCSGIIAGTYPALYLASFKPGKVLSNAFRQSIKKSFSRKIMVIVQFTSAIMLILGTLEIYRQLVYLRTADLGFNKEQIVLLYVQNTHISCNYRDFKHSLLAHPEIESLTGMSDIPGVKHNTYEYTPLGFKKTSKQFYPSMLVRYDFVKTFGLEVVAGRDLQKISNSEHRAGFLINEKMAEYLGCESMDEAVGKKLKYIKGEGEILGVIKNFNLTSLHSKITPFIISMAENNYQSENETKYLAIRIKPDKQTEALALIEKHWEKHSPEVPFNYEFLEDKLDSLYKNEALLVRISVVLTLLATFIASIGLLGLVSFLTELRTKEIGIRKILGASAGKIIKMFSYEFLKLILISNLIAAAPAYFILKTWLSGFAYQTTIPWWLFIVTMVISLLFALIMVAYKVVKTAIKNPIDAVRTE